jgi:adenine-specific DNA-methyltransferase
VTKPRAKHVTKTTPNPVVKLRDALHSLAPHVFSEGRIDFEKLRAALGEAVDDGPERYRLTWAGKRDALRLVHQPSRGTLVPVPESSVRFEATSHAFIEGDNLEVLKLLYKPYCGRVKMIFIDPPYNTGNDLLYPDDFTDPLDTYLRLTGQQDAGGNLFTSNPETSGRYHSAWLSMMYPRLFLARQLLRDDGVIFVSIDDHEVHNLRLLMNELFGEEQFVTQIEWQKRYTRSNNTDRFTSVIDHILVYARSGAFRPNLLKRNERADQRYANPDNDPRGPWKPVPFLNPLEPTKRPNLCYEITNPNTGQRTMPSTKAWRSEQAVFERYQRENRLWWGKDGTAPVPNIKRFLSEVRPGMTPTNFWGHEFAGHTDLANAEIKELFGDKRFDTPKPTRLVRRMLELATAPHTHDLVLDFFAGSCSTAQAVLELNRDDGGNRRFLCVQIPEPIPDKDFSTIAALGMERIRRVLARLEHRDVGLRVFRLERSHYRQGTDVQESDAERYLQHSEQILGPLVDGWMPEQVVWEVALKEGYGLDARIERMRDSAGNTFYRVRDERRDQALLLCLDGKLNRSALKRVSLSKRDLFICRDVALDDETAVQLAQQCRLKVI